ncbi:MAG: hypothetical protein ALECFALPRED_004977 [Alectoria fallacina]|uniref:Uncharacterized protein n=1 Tax=Alectoria fallacina TaxID=1903189 RepID=A0A8H3G1B9_9LECA|nr:MAG: hypothetical protein ALECFALPRED_004977 [Alectoria fallacina]
MVLLFTESLMAGRIQRLRIGYSATLKIRTPEAEAQHIETGHGNYLEYRDSILVLGNPQPIEERIRENQDLRNALAEGHPHQFTSFEALKADQRTRWQRFDFAVAREDDRIGEVGTVLVLTRPALI